MAGFVILLNIDSGEEAFCLPNSITICSRSSKSESVKRSSENSSYSLGFQDNYFLNAASFFFWRKPLDWLELLLKEFTDMLSLTTVGFFKIDFLVTRGNWVPLSLVWGVKSSSNLVSFLTKNYDLCSGYLVFYFSNLLMLFELGLRT